MLFNSLILAFTTSIDAFGIGVTYGLKNTKLNYIGKLILFFVALISTTISVFFGNFFKLIFSEMVTKVLGSILLIALGISIIYKALKEKNKLNNFDYNNDKSIDSKESLTLALAVSFDSFCVGIGGSIIGFNSFLFPIFAAAFHLSFLLLGNFLGNKISSLSKLPNNIWSIISGSLLILIAISKITI